MTTRIYDEDGVSVDLFYGGVRGPCVQINDTEGRWVQLTSGEAVLVVQALLSPKGVVGARIRDDDR